MMGNCRNRSLQARHVRFECDLDHVAEATQHACTDGTKKPGCGCGNAQTHGSSDDHAAVPVENTLAQQHEPQCHQRIRQSRKLGDEKRGEHQPRFMTEAELAQPPHGRERRRKVARDGAGSFS